MGIKNGAGKYSPLLIYFLSSFFILSCKTSSKSQGPRFYPNPVATTTMVKASSHYSKDSLLILLTDRIEKAHFLVETVNQMIITTAPKQRHNVYYKYRLEISDGQVIISGQYEIVIPKDIFNPNPPSPYWNSIHYSGDAMAGARGFEDMKIFLDGIHDAVLSYSKK